MKHSRKNVVLSPAVTAAISNMLFDKQGINVTPIIDALSSNDIRTRESVAITTALLMKGVKVEPTTVTRYGIENNGDYRTAKTLVREYTYKGYAPFDDKVYASAKIVYALPYEDESYDNMYSCYKEGYVIDSVDMSEFEWESLTEFDELPEDIRKYLEQKATNELMNEIVEPEKV